MPGDASIDEAPSRAQRLRLLGWNAAAFVLAYGACDAAARRMQVTRNLASAWDAQLPFVPWLIVPYLSSVPLLALGFLVLRDRQGLRCYSERLLLATSIGCLVMAAWPLSYQGARPMPGEAPWALAFALLHALDGPYNQWPSLHVAYAVIMGSMLMRLGAAGWVRALLAAWLVALALSTVLVGQHHLADLLGGLALGLGAWALVPARRAQPGVALHHAAAAMLALVLALTLGPWWLWCWLAACAAAVAWAYRSANADFLRKRDGGYPWTTWLLYGPYLLGYLLTWMLVRWRERARAPVEEWAPGLWVGRRLSASEAERHLPRGCSVIDLANELSETRSLRGPRYHAEPFLDLLPMPPATVQRVLDRIGQETSKGHPVFVHCAMGYSRSRQVAAAYLDLHRS